MFQIQEGWKILFRYLKRFKKQITVLVIVGIISAVADAIIPYVVGQFIDALISQETTLLYGKVVPLAVVFLGLWFLVQIVTNLVGWFNDQERRKLGTFIEAEYSLEATNHLVRLPVSYMKEHKVGETWEKINRGRNYTKQLTENFLLDLGSQLLFTVVGVIVAFSINPALATVIVVGVVSYIGSLIIVTRPLGPLFLKGHKAFHEAYGRAYDAVANYQTIKQQTAEDSELKTLKKMWLEGAFSSWFKLEKIWVKTSTFQRLIIVATQLIIFGSSIVLIGKGALTIGQLVSLNAYTGMVFGPFLRLGNQWHAIQNGVTAIEEVEKVFSLSEENAGRTQKAQNVKGNIVFENVVFSYGKNDKEVLKNVSFSITQGQKVALVGESGVGKSTSIELLSGYYMPTKGDVLIDGYNTKEVDLYSLREHIAVVPQEPVLFNDTVYENIAYGNPDAKKEDVIKAAKEAHADLFIEEFPKKYEQLVGERGIKLSVGQKQRIAIARAMLRNPKILILDEPTSALDSKTERLITESLEKLMEGRTTLIVAHRLSTVRTADKIFTFQKGQIVEEGTHKELIEKEGGVYRNLYEMHIGLS